MNSHTLISEAEKDAAIALVTRAHVDGRITADQMTDKIGYILSNAVYERDLFYALAGIPELPPGVMPWVRAWACLGGTAATLAGWIIAYIVNYQTAPVTPVGHAMGMFHAIMIVVITFAGVGVLAGESYLTWRTFDSALD